MRETCTSGSVRGEDGDILTYSASGARNLITRHHAVVSAVSVSQQNLPVTLKKIFRSVPASIEGEVEDVVGVLIARSSIITSKPAIRYHFKTGQRKWPKT
jgi:hypothetical protein